MRRGCKAAGDADPSLRQLGNHFPQRRILAADGVYIMGAKLREGCDERTGLNWHGSAPEVKSSRKGAAAGSALA
jgi:hypothetical protein